MNRKIVFISYAHVDKVLLIKPLVEIIRAGNFEPWFDHHLVPAKPWKKQLLEAIEKCDVFLYAMTPDSLASEWCLWELNQAVQLSKPIIPVRLQSNIELPNELGSIQWVDFSMGYTPGAVARLVAGINAATTISPEKIPQAPGNPQGTPSRLVSVHAQDNSNSNPLLAQDNDPNPSSTDHTSRLKLETEREKQSADEDISLSSNDSSAEKTARQLPKQRRMINIAGLFDVDIFVPIVGGIVAIIVVIIGILLYLNDLFPPLNLCEGNYCLIYDFVENACSDITKWRYKGGPRDGVETECNKTDLLVSDTETLHSYPPSGGQIVGLYTLPEDIQSGDRFEAGIGFAPLPPEAYRDPRDAEVIFYVVIGGHQSDSVTCKKSRTLPENSGDRGYVCEDVNGLDTYDLSFEAPADLQRRKEVLLIVDAVVGENDVHNHDWAIWKSPKLVRFTAS